MKFEQHLISILHHMITIYKVYKGPPFFPSSQKPTSSCKFQLDLGMLDDEPICRCSTVEIIKIIKQKTRKQA